MKTTLSILLIICSLVSVSQTNPTSEIKGDTLFEYQYFDEGNIRLLMKSIKKEDDWKHIYMAEYCLNGQLLWSKYSEFKNVPFTTFHCNGKTAFTSDSLYNNRPTGYTVSYYESGTIKEKGYILNEFDSISNSNKKDGEWHFYKKDGTLQKTEFYYKGTITKVEKIE